MPKVRATARHLTIGHHDLPVAQGCDLFIVGRDQKGRALVLVDLGDQVHHLQGRGAVKIAGRFVGQHQFGAVHQGPRHGHALLLAAGQVGGRESDAVGQPHAGQKVCAACPGRGVFTALADGGGEKDVFECGEIGQQVVKLEHKADVAVAELGAFGV